jgi:hypothetical protein
MSTYSNSSYSAPMDSESRPGSCNHNGGVGIGAGHVCRCVRLPGHPLDSDRPHGCSCGALWKDS